MNTFTVIDHTYQPWADVYKRNNRENGAATYGREILQYQVPVWKEELELAGYDDSVLVSTVPTLANYNGPKHSLVIQYLHAYPYADEMDLPLSIAEHLNDMGMQNIVFVNSCKPLVDKLLALGFKALHIPMTIDVGKMLYARSDTAYGPDRAIYFGNILGRNREMFLATRAAFKRHGIALDVISKNTFTSFSEQKSVIANQEGCWNIISRYHYGAGASRCAMEMMHLGVKVLISGLQFGGIITDRYDYGVQHMANFSGGVVTYDRRIDSCIEGLPLVQNYPTPTPNYAMSLIKDYVRNELYPYSG